MEELDDQSVQCVVTSPPYWGLRKYSGKQELIWGGDADCQHQWRKGNHKVASGGYTESTLDSSSGDLTLSLKVVQLYG